MVLLLSIKKLRDLFSFIPKRSLSYGILRKCKRCVYQKYNEPILLFSKDRGPRIIIYHEEVYVRNNDCVGYELCGRCFEQVCANEKCLSCEWKRI
jgi:hypothetical protein